MNTREIDIASRALATMGQKPKKAPVHSVRRADVAGIVEEEHGKYRIKAGQLGGVFVARAFPKVNSGAQGLIAEAEGETKATAIAALKTKIEARDVQRIDDRRWDEPAGVAVPNAEEYVEALRQAGLSRPQLAMLKALAFAPIGGPDGGADGSPEGGPDGGMTMAQLARVASYKSGDTAAKVLRKAAAAIAAHLDIEIDEASDAEGDGVMRLLVFRKVRGEDGPTVWIMHQELRDAVQFLF